MRRSVEPGAVWTTSTNTIEIRNIQQAAPAQIVQPQGNAADCLSPLRKAINLILYLQLMVKLLLNF
jgi:hypothetical protein